MLISLIECAGILNILVCIHCIMTVQFLAKGILNRLVGIIIWGVGILNRLVGIIIWGVGILRP